MDYQKWSYALAMTESTNNPHAWGDSGQAVGRWQMHPAFVWQYGPDDVGLSETWNDVCAQALQAFFNERSARTPDAVRLAMEFHLGVEGVAKGQWDAAYENRFKIYYGNQVGQS